MTKNKNYWMDEEKFSAIPGSDVHAAVAEFFADYYNSNKRHSASIKVNDVTVTLKRGRF